MQLWNLQSMYISFFWNCKIVWSHERKTLFLMQNSITTSHVYFQNCTLRVSQFCQARLYTIELSFCIQMKTRKIENVKSIMSTRLNDYLNAPFVLLTNSTSLHKLATKYVLWYNVIRKTFRCDFTASCGDSKICMDAKTNAKGIQLIPLQIIAAKRPLISATQYITNDSVDCLWYVYIYP